MTTLGAKFHLFPRDSGKDAVRGPPKLPEGHRYSQHAEPRRFITALLTYDDAGDGAGDPERGAPPGALPRLGLLLRLGGQDDVLASASEDRING